MKIIAIAATSVFLLSACATSIDDCDPSVDNGFFGKIGCSVSGSYEKRVELKEAENAKLLEQNKELALIHEKLENDNRLLTGTISQREKALKELKANIKALEKSLNEKKTLSAKTQEAIDKMKAQIDNMSESDGSILIQKREEQLKELQAIEANLRKQDSLNDLFL